MLIPGSNDRVILRRRAVPVREEVRPAIKHHDVTKVIL
jgi:hypothetical protein